MQWECNVGSCKRLEKYNNNNNNNGNNKHSNRDQDDKINKKWNRFSFYFSIFVAIRCYIAALNTWNTAGNYFWLYCRWCAILCNFYVADFFLFSFYFFEFLLVPNRQFSYCMRAYILYYEFIIIFTFSVLVGSTFKIGISLGRFFLSMF